jgi:hypothetical protein
MERVFWYIPGIDTCLKLGGYLRIDTTLNGGAHGQPAWSGDIGQQSRYRDYWSAPSRTALTRDTRAATEGGVLRAFAQGGFQFITQGSEFGLNVFVSKENRRSTKWSMRHTFAVDLCTSERVGGEGRFDGIRGSFGGRCNDALPGIPRTAQQFCHVDDRLRSFSKTLDQASDHQVEQLLF